MNGEPTPPLSEAAASPPPLIANGWSSPRPFSRSATVVFALLAVALFFFRNWFYLTGSRLDSFSYPEVTVSWVLHQDMLLHEGAGKLTKNEKLLLRLIGLRLDGIPEDSERMLRDTITHLDKPQRNRAAVDELRAQLAVLLAETGSLTNAMEQLALLSKSAESGRFESTFRSMYATNGAGLTRYAPDSGRTELLSGWSHWRFTARGLKGAGNVEKLEKHEASIRREAEHMLRRLIILLVAAWLVQMVGLVSLARCVLRRVPSASVERSGQRASWTAAESWGLFVRGFLYGLIAEQLLVRLPFFGYAAWLTHGLVFSLPVIALLGWRHWRRDPTSFGRFFGIAKTAEARANLRLAGLALFAICWLSLLWIPELLEALGLHSHWADAVDDILLTCPWYARIVHLADGIFFSPLMEEIVFRGLLYGALRTRLAPLPAAGISAVLFGATHFYGLPGFLGVALFGFWCAVAREKTGSLLPGIAAHMLTNLFIVGGQAWVNL